MIQNSTNKNGKIEFLRFVFCMSVVLFHFNLYYYDADFMITDSISLFNHGNIGVEFFFIVSGYLFASHCFKNREETGPIGKSTIKFMYHKWLGIFPYHLVAFFLTFMGIVVMGKLTLSETFFRFLESLPNLFLIQKTGIYAKNIIGAEWYITVLLLSLFVLYPICKKDYDLFTHVIAPVLGVFLVGYMCQVYGRLSDATVWGSLFARCQIRGFAEICLGAFAFEVVRFLNKHTFTKPWRVVLTILEVGCYIFALWYICSSLGYEYEAYVLYALLIGVCLTFSDTTYGKSLFQNKFIYFLGRISLPIYLCQTFVGSVIQHYCVDFRIRTQFILIMIGIFVVAVFDYKAGDKIKQELGKIAQNWA